LNQNNDCLSLAVRLAAEMMRCGGETYRAEECCHSVLAASGATDISVVALPTALIVGATLDGKHRTKTAVIKTRSIDLAGIANINRISRLLASGELSVLQAACELERERKARPIWRTYLYFALTAGFFSVVFNGGEADLLHSFKDFIPAFLAAMITRCFIGIFSNRTTQGVLSAIGGSMITAFLAKTAVAFFPELNQEAIIIGGIMSMLPGLALVNALRDTINGDLVSGVSRGTQALLTGIAIAAGVGIVVS